MTDAQRRLSAKQFAANWHGRGDEKQETQRFWIELLTKVFGVDGSTAIDFEVRVKLGHTSFIDGYIASTRVLIEQKGQDIDLKKGYKQSDGSMLTPYQQARRYAGYLPFNQTPRWIVVCNFKEFHIHDMNRPNDAPEVVDFGTRHMRTICLFNGLLAFSHCVAGIMRGAGKATVPMATMLVCWCLIRVSYITIAVRIVNELTTVSFAYPLTWTISSIVFLIYLVKGDWIHTFDRLEAKQAK